MLVSICNAKNLIRSYIGTFINNQFVGVSREHMEDFWKLKVICLVCLCVPLIFLYLIPTQAQIDECQRNFLQQKPTAPA